MVVIKSNASPTDLFDSFYVSTMTAVTVDHIHRIKSTPTNGHRFTVLGLS